jgi:Putative Flp pilus-assembly TadE/G-like
MSTSRGDQEEVIHMTPASSDRLGERGQVLAIVAGGITALLLLSGLVLDGGIAFFNRRDAQNIADVAALAGTRIVHDHYTDSSAENDQASDVYAAIQTSMDHNGCSSTGAVPCTWIANWVYPNTAYGATGPVYGSTITNSGSGVPPGVQGVQVYVNRQPSAFLVRLAGIQAWNITAESVGWTEKIAAAPKGKLLPIALKEDPTPGSYNPGQVYDLTDGMDAPGGFGYISWNGDNSAGALATSICDPNNPAFIMPTSFVADPGKTNADDVRACLNNWISSGETVLIPIYDIVTGTGNGATYHIVGLAAFVVTAVDQPAIDDIQGYFVEIYPYAAVPAGVSIGPPTAGDTSANLTLIK